ncbi:TnsA endonuclease N-terminal domain-containing protein [Aquabacterium sp.]|uniref:TnsA endonuclease N-terminal domain-containing protein n=1 Tax=Aquabacterium sp. TaxID=1872578 RepID=UPI002487A7FD|nr:TnsA endonuclease N-terminal domain-containing protein [Aquabacterium sp.]MDI1258291.1 TnsA endonuclease N-terminal domain-containing protein [Aquabacterium sp.]
MGIRRTTVTEASISKKWSEGFGQGCISTYKPWETVQSFSSKGNSHRVHSTKTGRTHHLFSNIERALFLKAEYGESFIDFQEQRAMEREHTLAIAEVLKIKHPVYVGTQIPFVMTLDAVVVRRGPDRTEFCEAYDAKEASALIDSRVLEKLSIHKAYCEQRGWRHTIVTNETISREVIRNLEWIRMGAAKPGEVEPVVGLFEELPERMLASLKTKGSRRPINQYCAEFDRSHGLPGGAALRVLQILLWRHDLSTSLSGALIHLRPVSSLEARKPSVGQFALRLVA